MKHCPVCKQQRQDTEFNLTRLMCDECTVGRVALGQEIKCYLPRVPSAIKGDVEALEQYAAIRQRRTEAPDEVRKERYRLQHKRWYSNPTNRINACLRGVERYDKMTNPFTNPDGAIAAMQESQERSRKLAEAAGRVYTPRMDLNSPDGRARALRRAQATYRRRLANRKLAVLRAMNDHNPQETPCTTRPTM